MTVKTISKNKEKVWENSCGSDIGEPLVPPEAGGKTSKIIKTPGMAWKLFITKNSQNLLILLAKNVRGYAHS